MRDNIVGTNGRASSQPALSGTIKVVGDDVRAITAEYGSDYFLKPFKVIGEATDGDACLIVFDKQSRPYFLCNVSVTDGAAGIVWRGNWNAATAYEVNDAVFYSGSSYRRLVAGTTSGNPGSDTTNWTPIALKGTDGAPGPTIDATTSSKGVVQLAGDLTGTAASPQIAAGVITASELNASLRRRVGETPSTRLYVEDFGAVGDGVTNDTAAIQSAIDTALGLGSATVVFGPQTYLVNSAPRTDRAGNCILSLAAAWSDERTIRFEGSKDRTQIQTTLTGLTYSATYGPPSVIGGVTKEQNATALSPYEVQMDGIKVVVPANPTISGIDLGRHVRARLIDTQVTSTSPTTQPTNVWTFGIRLPQALNYGDLSVGATRTFGMYVGLVVNTAHSHIHSHVSKWCVLGVGLTGNTDENTMDPHAAKFDLLKTEWCTGHMAGWNPSTGGGHLASGKRFTLICDLWNIEDYDGSTWYTSFYHLADANSQIYGKINYLRVKANTGIQAGGTIVGGINLAQTDLSVSPVVGAPSLLPHVRVRRGTAQALTHNTPTAISFSLAEYDNGTASPHWSAASPTRLTAQVAGLYRITAALYIDTTGGGDRSGYFRLNGTTTIAAFGPYGFTYAAAINQPLNGSTEYRLAVGDYVEVVVNQTSGTARNVIAVNESPVMTMSKASD